MTRTAIIRATQEENDVSMLYLAQANQQQQLDWLDGGTLAILLDGAAADGQLMMGRFDVSEGGVVFLPKGVPHGYRITSKKADLLMINTPGGIEGMFRAAGRDRSAPPPPADFQPSPEQMAEAAAKYGNIILGPPR